jgi:aminomuconate-semialdehyde/2-hydroxymuconate-6-semialdehyde dehydrogenase
MNWIRGEKPAIYGDELENVNPATGEVIGMIARSKRADVNAAVASAKKALPEWSQTPLSERCAILTRAADLLEERLDEFAKLESEDSGKPITTASTIDIPRSIANLRFFADFAANEQHAPTPMEGGSNRTHRQPVGVVALITPWNLPLYLLTWKLAPALAMGNTVIAKPSEMTPRTAIAMAKLLEEAGLPEGVVNIINGIGPEAGAPLVEHKDVSAVSFTGGTATGQLVARSAAPSFKKLSLELGGKNPGIVFADADLNITIPGIARAAFTNQGQVCLCSSRILVADEIYVEFKDRLMAELENWDYGDPADPGTKQGSLISRNHRRTVAQHIRSSKGKVLCGGRVPEGPGAFYPVTVVTGVKQNDPIVQEEVFGPVATLQTFTSEEDAIQMANDVPYGLAATVWTTDKETARRVSEQLQTGMVWINDWLKRDLAVPFGGMKQSGVGREGGKYSLDFYSEIRNIYEAA